MIEYVFFYKDIIVGGCELLIEKVSRQIMQSGILVKIFCRTIDASMLERFSRLGVEIYRLKNWNSNKELREFISDDKEVRMITFFWEDFTRVYLLKRRRMRTILYAVHFQVLAVGANCRFPVVKKLLKSVGARSIFRLLQAQRILCMDEQTVRYTQNYFQKKFLDDTSMYAIARVPIEVVSVNDDQLKKRADNPELNILAIARAEFPFKGYLLGLVDFVEGLEDKSNLHVDIISYGPDIEKLKSRIDILDTETRRVIDLHGKTDYDGLERYFDYAKLYIGMGTTILDAAQRGIVSIPVVPYTEEMTADKFFHEDYRILAVDGSTSDHMANLYQSVSNLSPEKYLQLSKKTRNVVVENYSVGNTVQVIRDNFEKIKDDKYDSKVFMFMCIGFMQRLMYRFFET